MAEQTACLQGIAVGTCENWSGRLTSIVSVMDLKKELAALSAKEQAEMAAFLFQLRRQGDADYQATLGRRLKDKDPSHWLTPDEFERRLKAN
jgi:hypothetical protein